MKLNSILLGLCLILVGQQAYADCTAVITPAGPTTFCAGDSVVLNAPAGSGLTYEWKRGTTVVGTNARSLTVLQSGNYTVTVHDGSCTQTSAAVTVTVNSLPGATISPAGPLVLCPGESRQIMVPQGISLPGAPQPLFTWKNGSSIIVSNTTDNRLTVNAAGTYTVQVTNPTTGCSRLSDPYVVSVDPLPRAVITPAGPTTFCAGDSVVLNAPAGSGLTYEWKRGTAVVGTNARSLTVLQSGNYTVTLHNGSCTQTSAAVTVTVNSLPGATISPAGPLVLCPGESRQIMVPQGISLPGAPQPLFTWKNGSSIIVSNTTDNRLTVNAAGTYTVQVTNPTTGCSRLSDPYVVSVNPLPRAVITPSWATDICEGGHVRLDAGSVAGYDYQWKRNGTAAGVSAEITATESGDYKVIVTDDVGCKDSSTVTTVTVHSKPHVAIAPGDTAVCAGEMVSLQAVTSDTGLNYIWYDAVGAIAGATDSMYGAETAGTYHVLVNRKDVHECADTSSPVQITINDLPEPDINHEEGRLWTSGEWTSYQWYIDDTVIPGAEDSAWTTNESGVYKVLVTDANGCSNFSDTLHIAETDDHSGIYGHSYAERTTLWYPNPVQNRLYILSETDVVVHISNLEGRVMLTYQGRGSVSLEHLSAGVYLVRMTDISGSLLRYDKLIKK